MESASENKGSDKKKVIKKDPLKVVARKPFVLESIEPTKDKEKEMAVFTAAKKLSEYIFVVTQNAPAKFRWSIIAKLQNTSIEVVETLYLANFERGAERLRLQKIASTKLRLVDHYAEIGYKVKLFPFKRLVFITRSVVTVRGLLAGWAKSTLRRDKAEADCASGKGEASDCEQKSVQIRLEI